MSPILVFLNAALCAANAGFYVALGKPWSLAVAILSGFTVLFLLATGSR